MSVSIKRCIDDLDDCMHYERKRCLALQDTRFKSGKCPFYKPEEYKLTARKRIEDACKAYKDSFFGVA